MQDNGLDEEGFLRTEVSQANITSQFSNAVNTAQESINDVFQDKLHSIYIYGSIVTGKAVFGSSDLDMFVVFINDVSIEEKETISSLEKNLSKQFRLSLREVGIESASLSEIFRGGNEVGWGCFLKHQCVCLQGEDLGNRFPKFKPTKAVAYGLNGDIESEIEKSKQVLMTDTQDVPTKAIRSISRKMIRTAFCLVSEDANCWTTDLNQCCRIFVNYYPQHRKEIERIRNIAEGTSISPEEFIAVLNGFGVWLCKEVELKLKPFAKP